MPDTDCRAETFHWVLSSRAQRHARGPVHPSCCCLGVCHMYVSVRATVWSELELVPEPRGRRAPTQLRRDLGGAPLLVLLSQTCVWCRRRPPCSGAGYHHSLRWGRGFAVAASGRPLTSMWPPSRLAPRFPARHYSPRGSESHAQRRRRQRCCLRRGPWRRTRGLSSPAAPRRLPSGRASAPRRLRRRARGRPRAKFSLQQTTISNINQLSRSAAAKGSDSSRQNARRSGRCPSTEPSAPCRTALSCTEGAAVASPVGAATPRRHAHLCSLGGALPAAAHGREEPET